MKKKGTRTVNKRIRNKRRKLLCAYYDIFQDSGCGCVCKSRYIDSGVDILVDLRCKYGVKTCCRCKYYISESGWDKSITESIYNRRKLYKEYLYKIYEKGESNIYE